MAAADIASSPVSTSAVERALASARETRALKIGSGILNRVPGMARQLFGSRPVFLVMDANTEKAVGSRLLKELLNHPTGSPFVFRDPELYAEHRFVAELEDDMKRHYAIPIAVGSGTINDLVKLAAHRQGRSYLSVATAASMDGYTAFGASITYQGSKQTFTCPAPSGVVADLEIIAAAPPHMNASGYADLLAKITAGADWLLADALGVEPVVPKAWEIVQGRLPSAVSDPGGVARGDLSAIARLTEGLMLGGFAMQCAQSSRPASGAEHQFSHLWDMQHHTHNGSAPSHGFKVGIGTLVSAALYEFLLRQPIESLDAKNAVEALPDVETSIRRAKTIFGDSDLFHVASKELPAKHASRESLFRQLEKLRVVWPHLCEKLRKQLLPFDELKKLLRLAGAAYEPEQIGINRQRLRDSFWPAYSIRRRFTVLDVMVQTGLLEPGLANIFGPRGPWPC